jgi:hypothetical protein
MKHRLRLWMLVLMPLAAPAALPAPQVPMEETLPQNEGDVRLPNGKSQREEILKLEHQQNVRDAARLVELAGELKDELEKNTHNVLSISTLRKTDDIEKLAKKIRSRLRRN